MRIRLKGFDYKNCKLLQLKKIHIVLIKNGMYLSVGVDPNEAQEAFSPQKRVSGTLKHWFLFCDFFMTFNLIKKM